LARLEINLRPAATSTSALRPKRAFQDQTFGGRVIIDGATFERCRFRGAVLVYTGGAPPSIQGCSFEDVSFEFAGAAGRTMGVLKAMSAPSSGLRDVFKASFPRIFGH
jgi:hypothetical protein